MSERDTCFMGWELKARHVEVLMNSGRLSLAAIVAGIFLYPAAAGPISYDYIQLDYPGAADTFVYGMNDQRQVVGYYDTTSGGNVSGFFWSNGIFTSLQYPGSLATSVFGISNDGSIAGYYALPAGGGVYGFLYNINTSSLTVGPNGTTVRAVNNNDQVLAHVGGTHDYYIGTLGGSLVELPKYPGASDTTYRGINSSGSAVGWYTDAGNARHVFLYSGGTFLPISCGASTGAFGMNDSGTAALISDAGQNYLYSGGSCSALSLPPGAEFMQVEAINNLGDFGGLLGFPGDSSTHGFIALQTPEPAAAGLVLIGLLFGAALWKRERNTKTRGDTGN